MLAKQEHGYHVGKRNRGTRRPVRPTLSRDYIIRAALDIIDRHGVDALSMRRLGSEIGVDPMAVYYYLPSKAALFDGLVEVAYAEIGTDFELLGAGSWRDGVSEYMHRLRDVLRSHPGLIPVIATRPAYTSDVLKLGDSAIAALRDAGFDTRDAVYVINCLRSFTVGEVFADVGEPVGGPTATVEDAAKIINEGYPNLADGISGGYDPDEKFEVGLQAMLDGFERRLLGRTGRLPRPAPTGRD